MTDHDPHEALPEGLRPNEERLAAFMRESLGDGMEQFKHQPNDDAMRLRVTAFISGQLQRMVDRGEQPPNYWRYQANGTQEDVERGIFKLYMVRDFRHYPMSDNDFRDFFSRAPEQDDLHRVNCKEAGKVGHYSCGWCMDHETAMWDCGCIPDRHNVGRDFRGPTPPYTGPGVQIDVALGITAGPMRPPPPPRVVGNVTEDLHLFSMADASKALNDGVIDKDQAIMIGGAFMGGSVRSVIVCQYVPEDTPPSGALATEPEIVRFIRERFPDVHEAQAETNVEELSYVVTVTTHLAELKDREDLTARIHAAIEPYATLGVAFEVRSIPVGDGPFR